jgi:hypothetical protein
VPKSKHIKATDKVRFDEFRKIGCICCKQMGWFRDPEVHHITDGGRRIGHQETLPLCEWHHRAVRPYGLPTDKLAARVYGPSLASGKKTFQDYFGSELELLEDVNALIRKIAET